jgi:hypothetical protein
VIRSYNVPKARFSALGHDFGEPIFDQTAAVFGSRKLLQEAGNPA